ncbi:universal stress protein [Chromobacterium sp. IIBBL 290-4]|uniref:universal stress protein n=1 Tax=Chromobacterium sp. IIBBL 290-4 TaxID=2953890 RepID=UPI0020B7EFA8|nr:universal stress protein [Chromobacterium sp. IIBBL 290-4]UTH75519.1 universal stress protein [Chromobacterium sp. IIBBL 290-4]
MYRHLIAAIDGSNNSDKALNEAIRVAKHTDARLTLVHIASLRDLAVDSLGVYAGDPGYDLALQQGEEALARAQKLARDAGLINVASHLEKSWEGGHDLADLLIGYAQSQQADLIVLGTHGRKGLAHLFLGSFAEDILRRSPIPLLVVRSTEDEDISVE